MIYKNVNIQWYGSKRFNNNIIRVRADRSLGKLAWKSPYNLPILLQPVGRDIKILKNNLAICF